MASSTDAHISGEASQLSDEEHHTICRTCLQARNNFKGTAADDDQCRSCWRKMANNMPMVLCKNCQQPRWNTTGMAAYNDQCRPCWRKIADNMEKVLCQGCQEQRWNTRGTAAQNNYCKSCWRECWNRNDRPRTEDECRICKSTIRTKGGRNSWQVLNRCIARKHESDSILRDDTTYTERCLFIGNLDEEAYQSQHSLVTLIKRIWADYIEKLIEKGRRPTNYVPTIKSTRLRSLKQPIPAGFERKRFGFIEFDRVIDAYQTLEWIHRFNIKDREGRSLRGWPAVVCGSGEGKPPGKHGSVDQDLCMADLWSSEIARLTKQIRKVENRILASLERKVRKQAKKIRKVEKMIHQASGKYKRLR